MFELIERMRMDTEHLSVADKFLGGAVVSVFSMFIVFCVLILLMYVIKGIGLTAVEKKAAPAAAPAAAAPSAPAPAAIVKDESEVIAAVMAAVNSMSTSEGSRIVIKNIVKKQDNWGTSGLLEQMNSRL